MLPDNSEPAKHTRSNLGRRTQIGGAIAIYIGVMLRLFGPAPASPLNLHGMAWLFIAIGLFLFVAGTVARRLFLD